MIATCEVCGRQRVPCFSEQESQRLVCYVCQGDAPADGRGWLAPVLFGAFGAVLGLLSTWAAVCFCVSL